MCEIVAEIGVLASVRGKDAVVGLEELLHAVTEA